MTIEARYVQVFRSISTDLPLGACWKATDIDNNQAVIWLSHVHDCKNVYRYKFVMWHGEIFKEGETSSVFRCWGHVVNLLRPNPKNGLLPDLARVENYYTGRPDHG